MASPREIHRIGGADLGNLRLKPRELTLNPPGISVLLCSSPDEAAEQMIHAFPQASQLKHLARTVASTSLELIADAGFELIHSPLRTLPNHYRFIHRDGGAGFTDENLSRLSQAFETTQIGES